MLLKGTQSQRRRGTAMAEAAIVLPVTFLLLFAVIVGGLGVFRFQQLASLAREASRYASVHGQQYQVDTGRTAATATDIYNNAIKPGAAGLNLSKLTYTVTWNTSNWPTHNDPSSNPPGKVIGNTVTVSLSYQWIPEVYFTGVTLKSTSTVPMAY